MHFWFEGDNMLDVWQTHASTPKKMLLRAWHHAIWQSSKSLFPFVLKWKLAVIETIASVLVLLFQLKDIYLSNNEQGSRGRTKYTKLNVISTINSKCNGRSLKEGRKNKLNEKEKEKREKKERKKWHEIINVTDASITGYERRLKRKRKKHRWQPTLTDDFLAVLPCRL